MRHATSTLFVAACLMVPAGWALADGAPHQPRTGQAMDRTQSLHGVWKGECK